jgi:hypothetical protein
MDEPPILKLDAIEEATQAEEVVGAIVGNVEAEPAVLVPPPSDASEKSSVVRQAMRLLSGDDADKIMKIREATTALIATFRAIGQSREIEAAIMNAEQAMMWAMKHITR